MLYDTKLSPHATVVAFYKCYPELTRLHREVKVEGYDAAAIRWWTPYDNGKSLFMFGIESEFRQMCGAIVTNDSFDKFILFCILLGTILLAISSPLVFDPESKVMEIFNFIDLLTNIIFTIEMMMRIVWMEFYMAENAYMNDGWFQMDFAIVCLGWLSLIDGFPNFKSFRGFRALRAIKGIRVLSYCSAVMDALFEAVPLFVDVALVTIFCIIIFGIMGVQSFAGAYMRRCEWMESNCSTGLNCVSSGNAVNPELYCGKDLYGNEYAPQPDLPASGLMCPRGSLCVRGDNPNDGWTSFDNIVIGSFTIFQMMTLEGWTDLMYAALTLTLTLTLIGRLD